MLSWNEAHEIIKTMTPSDQNVLRRIAAANLNNRSDGFFDIGTSDISGEANFLVRSGQFKTNREIFNQCKECVDRNKIDIDPRCMAMELRLLEMKDGTDFGWNPSNVKIDDARLIPEPAWDLHCKGELIKL